MQVQDRIQGNYNKDSIGQTVGYDEGKRGGEGDKGIGWCIINY